MKLGTVRRTPLERPLWHQSLATSAAKRKWKRKGFESSMTDAGTTTVTSSASTTRDRITEGVNWRPLFFLGILPVLLTGVVVLTRDDLFDQLEENGIGRLFRDLRRLKAARAEEAERAQSNETSAMVGEVSFPAQNDNPSLEPQHPRQ
jgi:hypothetical protein